MTKLEPLNASFLDHIFGVSVMIFNTLLQLNDRFLVILKPLLATKILHFASRIDFRTKNQIQTLPIPGWNNNQSNRFELRYPRVFTEVGFAFLQEGIPALSGFIGHVGESCRFACKYLLSHHTIVGEVHGKL